MNPIENLNIGHIKHGLNHKLKIRISEEFDDASLEADFPHRHNFYMLSLVIKGNGKHVIDFEEIEIKPRRLFFLKPEQVHFWDLHPGSALAVLQFSADFMTQLFNFNSLPALHTPSASYFDLISEKAERILEIIRRIEAEQTSGEAFSEKIIQAEIFILLTEIEREIRSESAPKSRNNKYEILNNFQQLLHANYKEYKTISRYAEILGITPNYLNIIIKETTGNTANELIHNRILLEAKRLLIQHNTDITQVAYELGFSDASYFARFFKKATGQSPSDFRSEMYKMYQHPDK
jgi:AraC family transcriptional regulator, transcriptional activator of pobA